jgi:hemerythrin superfamily protein
MSEQQQPQQHPLDAVEFLVRQHRAVEALLADAAERIAQGSPGNCFAEAADQLTVHIKSEEEIFYPAVNAARTEDSLLESLEEHLSLKRLLADLVALDPADKTFEAKFKVLKEQTEHHHKEEEEHLFPAVRKLLDRAQLAALGREMIVLQDELCEQRAPRAAVLKETASAPPLP